MGKSPENFIVRLADAPPNSWPVDDRSVDYLWLPVVGPTGIAIARTILRDFEAGPQMTRVFNVAEVAQRIGTSPSRCWVTVERLMRFRFLSPTLTTTKFEYDMPCQIRKPEPKEFGRLPSVVRDRYREVVLRG